jgi:hypothetical protein
MKIKINLLIIFIIVLICLKCCYSNNRKEEKIPQTDTITIIKRDTITIIKPQSHIRYVNRIVRDTLYSIDSIPVPVNLPIEVKVYQDSNYRAIISGYRPQLDSISIFNKNQIQTINKITYKTKKWNFSPSVGIGYGMFGKRIDMYVGFSLNYNF